MKFPCRLGSDAANIFQYSELLEQLRKYGKFGLIAASLMLPMLTSEAGNTPDLDELAEEVSSGKDIDTNVFISNRSRNTFMKRLREVVMDMARLEYI